MKKKTSIRIFKITFLPPIAILGSYFAAGLLMELYAAIFMSVHETEEMRANIVSFAKYFASEKLIVLNYLYYIYIFVFFLMILLNASFLGTFLYFKTGFFRLSPREFHIELVKNNKILFWDEYVRDTLENE